MREMLFDHKNEEGIKVHCATIIGMYFEAEICERIRKVDIMYSKKDLKVMTAAFTTHVIHSSDSPVKGLLDGVVYHWRPFHPVLDDVA